MGMVVRFGGSFSNSGPSEIDALPKLAGGKGGGGFPALQDGKTAWIRDWHPSRRCFRNNDQARPGTREPLIEAQEAVAYGGSREMESVGEIHSLLGPFHRLRDQGGVLD